MDLCQPSDVSAFQHAVEGCQTVLISFSLEVKSEMGFLRGSGHHQEHPPHPSTFALMVCAPAIGYLWVSFRVGYLSAPWQWVGTAWEPTRNSHSITSWIQSTLCDSRQIRNLTTSHHLNGYRKGLPTWITAFASLQSSWLPFLPSTVGHNILGRRRPLKYGSDHIPPLLKAVQ